MGEVLPFTGITIADIPPEDILEKAKEADLDMVVVLGFTKDNQLYFAGSTSDCAEVNWALDQAKQILLEQ